MHTFLMVLLWVVLGLLALLAVLLIVPAAVAVEYKPVSYTHLTLPTILLV